MNSHPFRYIKKNPTKPVVDVVFKILFIDVLEHWRLSVARSRIWAGHASSLYLLE
jgi:hypothetical protein